VTRILVTGGAGYVGSHAVRALLEAGHDVWVYDNLCRGHAEAVPTGLLIVGELADEHRLRAVLEEHRIEAVMHFAAFALVGESMSDPARYYRNNVAAGLSLLEAMRAAGVKRIVFSSTTATYGTPQVQPISEDTPQMPINPYGFTKLCFERMLDDYARAYGWAAAALRYFNAAGASADGQLGEDHDPETHLIPLVLQVALGQRNEVVIFGDDYPTPDGTCVRDYVHVEDLATAHLLALQRLEPGKVLKVNLGTGTGWSVRQVVEACRRVTGHPIPARVGPRREGDPPVLVADVRRAQSVLGWTPRYQDLDQIVATAWNFHRNHPRGFRK
jgi:UDP-glucose 4-epimerase